MSDYNGSNVALENIVICLEQGKNHILSAFTVIRHHEGCFPHMCNVSSLTEQCFEPNAERFVCSQNIPKGEQLSDGVIHVM